MTVAADELRRAWRVRVRRVPVEPQMTTTERGVVLGAGTTLLKGSDPANGGDDERVLALLTVAYARTVAPSVLGNIRWAARSSAAGDKCLALIHLARSGLPALDEGDAAPFRLFAADRLLRDGVSPRRLLELLDLDTSGLDALKAGYDPGEPRVPAGNHDGGEWTTGEAGGASPDNMAVVPAAARRKPHAGEYRTGDPSRFFDTVYDKFHSLAQRLGIDENWLFGLAVIESGWLDEHNRDLNDPFGVTHAGGANVQYPSIDRAIAYWEGRYGPVIRGSASARDFVQRLFNDGYNTDAGWPALIMGGINSVPRHLSAWKEKRGI